MNVSTSVNALSRLLFVDDTTLTVGANSSMILDRFVYDPKTAKGEILVHMATGVFRFVSGKMPKENVTLVTPGASIGIRGTDFIVEILGDGTTRVSVLHGRVIMTPTAGGNTFSSNLVRWLRLLKSMKTGQVETCPASNCAPSTETAATTL
ncbi:MAG: FecR family protein [Alphaproteobacteria bacterium]